METKARAVVGMDEVAESLNLSVRRVFQLRHEGLPCASRGRFDEKDYLRWYVRYLQRKLEQRAIPRPEGGVYESTRNERARLILAEARLKEIELAKELSQVVTIADVEKEMTDLVQVIKAQILAIGPRLAAELVGEPSRTVIQAKIEKYHREALVRLAKSKFHSNGNERRDGAA